MYMEEIKVFCPATIANLNCGFDVLGVCINGIGDEMIFRKTNQKGIKIVKIEGANLPYETHLNVAGVPAQAVYNAINPSFGIEIEIYKKIKAGSGIGSSSASAAGAAFGVNELLGKPFTKKELIGFAIKGEALASGSEHADNVAPCMLGGFTLIRSYNPLDIIEIPTPKSLYAVVLHPHIEIKTADARALLSPNVSLKNAVEQSGNLAGLIAGLYTSDYQLIGRSLIDKLVEPLRKQLIPYFDEVKTEVENAGALGFGISGAGPSMFALCYGEDTANKVAQAMNIVYSNTKISFDVYLSSVNTKGVELL